MFCPPPSAEDVGKSVIVGEDGKYELAESSNPLPVPVLPQDVGKTIVVNEDGSYTLAEAGSGANVLTLYSNVMRNASDDYLYKDYPCTQKYTSMLEAQNAVRNADIIKIRHVEPSGSWYRCETIGNLVYDISSRYNSYQVSIVTDVPTFAGNIPNITITTEKKQFKVYWFKD